MKPRFLIHDRDSNFPAAFDEAVLAEYVDHYNGFRPHRSLELRPPRAPTVLADLAGGPVARRTRLDGLINEYSRVAA